MVICVWNLTLIHACGIDAEIKKKGNASFKIKYCKCNLDMWHKFITILQCNKLTREIMRDHPFVGCTFYTHWKHIWHMDKCVNKWNMKLLMNKYHTKFVISYHVSNVFSIHHISVWNVQIVNEWISHNFHY